MQNSNLDVLLVNPPLDFPSDTSGRSGLLRSREFLLNMGLLSVASHLKGKGFAVAMHDLTVSANPGEELEKLVSVYHPKYVGMSNQSCHSYLSTMECARLVKLTSATSKVVVGGLHASGMPETVLNECEGVDIVVVGEGELAMELVLGGGDPASCEAQEVGSGRSIIRTKRVVDINQVDLDYSLYPGFRSFVPYVEESRGCASQCEYCVSPIIHKSIRVRHAEMIHRDVGSLRTLYGGDDFHFFIEANNFGVNHRKTAKLAEMMAGNRSSWRTEARTDTFPVHLLGQLIKAGLRVLDIGLESGSPEMLIRMNKTKDPEGYLRSCVRIAEEIARRGECLLKLNIMLYYGETGSTVDATRKFLRLLSNICPLSVGIGPVRMEPGSRNFEKFVGESDLTKFRDSFWGKVHCYPVQLSEDMSFEAANRICLEIAQEFQTSQTYYQAKRHSQLRYDMTYADFLRATEEIPPAERQWMP